MGVVDRETITSGLVGLYPVSTGSPSGCGVGSAVGVEASLPPPPPSASARRVWRRMRGKCQASVVTKVETTNKKLPREADKSKFFKIISLKCILFKYIFM